jgi:hypothetical protein
MHVFIKEHPHVSILNPRISGVPGEWLATWIEASADPDEDGAAHRVTHDQLGLLLNRLEAMFAGPS